MHVPVQLSQWCISHGMPESAKQIATVQANAAEAFFGYPLGENVPFSFLKKVGHRKRIIKALQLMQECWVEKWTSQEGGDFTVL